MRRAVTAIYRTRATADLVRDELERIGVPNRYITILPEVQIVPDTDHASRSTSEALDLDRSFDHLHDLHLPEDDTRTYQQALRNGDVVVSVGLDDDTPIERVKEIMRQPEQSYDMDELDQSYRDAEYSPRRSPLNALFDDRQKGRRDESQDSPYTRTYNRDLALMVWPPG